jgi:hypothetical protein
MNRKVLLCGLMVMASVVLALGATQMDKPVLKTGNYTAKVTAIPCEGCPPIIEKTMLDQKGIGSAKADQKTSSLAFTVKPGAAVKVADLQKALKAASNQMGMGADYTLKNVTKVN